SVARTGGPMVSQKAVFVPVVVGMLHFREPVYQGRRLSSWPCRRTESLTFATAWFSTLAWFWSESARQDRAPVFQSGQAPTGLEVRPVPRCHSVQHQWPAL